MGMDPVSFAASLLTLLGAAGQTCEFVYNFIHDISELPHEIRSQAIKLRCLHQQFSALVGLYSRDDLPPELRLDPSLEQNLRNFLESVLNIRNRIQIISARLHESRTHRLRERVAWLSSDRRLRKFYNSLDEWMKIFSTAVSTTQLELLVRLFNRKTNLKSLPPAVCQEPTGHCNDLKLGSEILANSYIILPDVESHNNKQPVLGDGFAISKQETIIPRALNLYLSQTFDPVGLNVRHWGTIALCQLSADFRVGSAVVRTWSEKGKAKYKALSCRKGLYLSSVFREHRLFSRRITLVICAIIRAPKLSITCNLTICGMLQISSPAYIACQRGDWPLLRRLLQNGKVNISDTTGYGDTLLHIAARSNNYQMVSALLQQGAKVDAENDFGETPLQAAVKKNCSYNISSRLLGAGADLNHQDVAGRTPLHVFFNESVKTIIEYHQEDLDNTTQDARGMNIAQYVSWSKSSLPTDLFRCYKANTSSLETVNNEGKTAFHFACQRGNLALIQCFIDEDNPALSGPDWSGRTLMHYATESARSAEVISILARRGLDVRAVDHRGRTVLHHAASAGQTAAVEKLIELGAKEDLNALDDESRTPLQVAVLCGRKAVVEFLRPLYNDAETLISREEQVAVNCQGRESNAGARPSFSAFVSVLLRLGFIVTCFIILYYRIYI